MGGKQEVFPPSQQNIITLLTILKLLRRKTDCQPWLLVLSSGTRRSLTPVGTSTKASKTAERGCRLEGGFHLSKAELNTYVRIHKHSKPTCTIHVTWGRSSPRAATSFKINKEITVKMLCRYQQIKNSPRVVIMLGQLAMQVGFLCAWFGERWTEVKNKGKGLKCKGDW